jgi:hypothetical protein
LILLFSFIKELFNNIFIQTIQFSLVILLELKTETCHFIIVRVFGCVILFLYNWNCATEKSLLFLVK